MANKCNICSHDQRLEIDRKIIDDGNLSKIAREFNVPYDSLVRHAKSHLSRQLSQAYDRIQLQEDFDLLGRVDDILRKCEDIFNRNYEQNKDGLALKALAEQRSTIDLIQRISYNLHQAKMMELQLLQEKTGESAEAAKWRFIESVSVLSEEELKLLLRLQYKIMHKNQDKIISGNMVLKPKNDIKYDQLLPDYF